MTGHKSIFPFIRKICLLLFPTILCIPVTSRAQEPISHGTIDTLVQKTLKAFEVPGIAIGIVKDGELVYARGYGERSLGSGKKVDENTLFGIASNSKAFTTAALGILADEGKLKLDDKVTDYIPEFRLYDPWITAEFTIRDLLTHRSGLGLGAGDLMDFPDSTDFTLKDVIYNLRYFKPASSFRSKYDYDNQLYKVAGEVVARVSGMSWEDFVETRIMKPLRMSRSAAAFGRLKDQTNISDSHAPEDGVVRKIPRFINGTGNAAGGIYSSVADLSKWVAMHLNNGLYGKNGDQRLLSEAIHEEMWSPQTIIPVPRNSPYNTHFMAYGLGWHLRDVKGYKEVSHTGGVDGMVTKITLFPELKLGIIVLTNQQSDAAYNAITNQITDSYLGIKGRDWVKIYTDQIKKERDAEKDLTSAVWKQVAVRQLEKPNLDQYAGSYHDNWLGDALIGKKDGQMRFSVKRSPKLSGLLLPYKGNTCIIKWDERSMNADAYATFIMDEQNKPSGIKIKPISPLTDFSYDFQDLDFHKLQ